MKSLSSEELKDDSYNARSVDGPASPKIEVSITITNPEKLVSAI